MEKVFHIKDWEWREDEFGPYRSCFWTVREPAGKLWIVKFTGSFYSYREWVFSRLATRLGLNARKVRLARISKSDLLHIGRKGTEPFQLLLEPVEMHGDPPCNPHCPFPELKRHINEENDLPEVFSSSSVSNADDYILKDYMAAIFGANEPSECLFGTDHRVYIIDNEQMFSQTPVGTISAPWLFAKDGDYSERGHKLLSALCHKIISLTDTDLQNISKCPEEYRVDATWPILPILRKGKQIAHTIFKNGPTLGRRNRVSTH